MEERTRTQARSRFKPRALAQTGVLQGFLLVMLLVGAPQAWAGRSIGSLPHREDFATSAWTSDLRWVSQSAEARHMQGVSWNGGNAARFWLPTDGQGYSGLGAFTFSSGLAARRLNIRFVYVMGPGFIDDDAGLGPKHIIANRSTENDGDRFIAQQHAFGDGAWDLGVGNNISPEYPSPRVWDYGQHVGEPICFEFELQVGGQYKVWITKRNDDNWNERLLITQPVNNANGHWSMVQLIGAFGGPGRRGVADPGAWFQFSDLVIDDSYIGPPSGFTTSLPRPSPPTDVVLE